MIPKFIEKKSKKQRRVQTGAVRRKAKYTIQKAKRKDPHAFKFTFLIFFRIIVTVALVTLLIFAFTRDL